MDRGFGWTLCGTDAPRRRNQAQTRILKKRVTTKKTKAKSRTVARPALSHKTLAALKHFRSFLAPASYVFAVLILFQFMSVQLASGFYQEATPRTFVQVAATPGKKPPAKKGLPSRITIPSIRVNAVVRHVGLAPDGSMGVPKLPRDTAWYMFGPKPGERGSAVISGHVNWLYGAIGVFQNLKKLKPGDRITIQDEQGATTTFVVRETRTYGAKDDATEVFRSYDGKAHLNLITCTGIWDRLTKMYSKRLVVFTDKE